MFGWASRIDRLWGQSKTLDENSMFLLDFSRFLPLSDTYEEELHSKHLGDISRGGSQHIIRSQCIPVNTGKFPPRNVNNQSQVAIKCDDALEQCKCKIDAMQSQLDSKSAQIEAHIRRYDQAMELLQQEKEHLLQYVGHIFSHFDNGFWKNTTDDPESVTISIALAGDVPFTAQICPICPLYKLVTTSVRNKYGLDESDQEVYVNGQCITGLLINYDELCSDMPPPDPQCQKSVSFSVQVSIKEGKEGGPLFDCNSPCPRGTENEKCGTQLALTTSVRLPIKRPEIESYFPDNTGQDLLRGFTERTVRPYFGALRVLETPDFDVSRAEVRGTWFGSLSTVFPRANITGIPHKYRNKGIVLKMMYNYKIRPVATRWQNDAFECDCRALAINSFWGVPNVINYWRDVIQKKFIATSHESAAVDTRTASPRGDSEMYNKTTFILQELPVCCLSEATPRDLLLSAFQLLCTVEHFNRRGWFHMDIKQDNILLIDRPGFEGSFTGLCNFGSAIALDPPLETCILAAPPGTILQGNILNRAPELFNPALTKGVVQYDLRKNDVWALGCALWEMVYNQPLFSTSNEVLTKPISPNSTTPTTANPHHHPALTTLILGLLERNSHKRPTAELAALFAGLHLFLPPETPLESLEDTLLRARIDALAELKHAKAKPAGVPVRLFLKLVFLDKATPQLLAQAVTSFSFVSIQKNNKM
ncbi:hypothetical protein Pelo_16745 [Pelomyxa schiedti]|nr:hypothetical protein Pelo_16745 [Pelomyxa schiedti]